MKKNVIRIALVLILLLTLCTVFASPALAVTRNLYWVEVAGSGTGNWSDINHWSLASGGAGGELVPDADDNVYFDANSFVSGTGTVTVDAAADCLDMDWTGATNIPTLAGTQVLTAYGNITFILDMVASATGALVARTTTLTTNGLTLNFAYIQVSVVLTLGDDLSAKRISVFNTLNTAGYTVTLSDILDCPFGGTPTITLGASTINTAAWDMSSGGATPTLTANTATINVSGTGAFAGGGITTYNNVNLNGTAHTISGSNTFADLSFNSAIAQTITFTDGTNQTVTDAALGGSAGFIHTLTGTGVAGWTITKVGGGYIIADYLDLSYSTGAPVDTWSYWTHSTVGAGVVDWGVPFFYINIDGGDWENYVSAVGISVPDNANDWVLMKNTISYMDKYSHNVGGALVTEYEIPAMITDVTVPDNEVAGNDGTITWGTNDVDLSIVYGGMVSSESTYSTSSATGVGFVLPSSGLFANWFGDAFVGAGLPFHDDFSEYSAGSGIPEQTIYLFLIFGIAMFAAVVTTMLTRSMLVGSAFFAAVMVYGVQATIVAGWIVFAFIIMVVGIIFLMNRSAIGG